MIRKKGKKKSAKGGHVIHVDFGRGARLVEGPKALPGREGGRKTGSTSAALAEAASQALAVTEVFSATEAARLSGLTTGR